MLMSNVGDEVVSIARIILTRMRIDPESLRLYVSPHVRVTFVSRSCFLFFYVCTGLCCCTLIINLLPAVAVYNFLATRRRAVSRSRDTANAYTADLSAQRG